MKWLRVYGLPSLLSIFLLGLHCEIGLGATRSATLLEFFANKIEKPTQIPCTAPPLSGLLPVTPNLHFNDFRKARSFLTALSERTYSIDQKFLKSIATLLDDENADVVSIFVINAVLPFLQNTAEPAVKIQFLEPAISNLNCLNRAFQIDGLKTFQGIELFQAAALKMLKISFETGLKMMTLAEQKEAKHWSEEFSKTVEPTFSVERFEKIQAAKVSLNQLIKATARRPILRLRAEMNSNLCEFIIGGNP